MANVLVFGASTTYGAWDPEGGWVARLRKFIDQRIIESDYDLYYMVYNLGIGGDTTQGVLDRFEIESQARFSPEEENIFLINIGINDAIYVHQTKSLRMYPKEYKEKLQELVRLAKKHSKKVVLVEAAPVDESRVDPIPWLEGCSYKNEYIKAFDQVMKEVAEEEQITFIEVYEKFLAAGPDKLLSDGVHPNAKGHELIYQIVTDYLTQNNIIEL